MYLFREKKLITLTFLLVVRTTTSISNNLQKLNKTEKKNLFYRVLWHLSLGFFCLSTTRHAIEINNKFLLTIFPIWQRTIDFRIKDIILWRFSLVVFFRIVRNQRALCCGHFFIDSRELWMFCVINLYHFYWFHMRVRHRNERLIRMM